MIQTTIFDAIYPKFKIDKPIRLIELFGGYGSQALALKYLGIEFEHWKLVEWAVKSIQAYKDIHFSNKKLKGINIDNIKEQDIKQYLFEKGISNNYNEPMTKEQIDRLSYSQCKQILENILITHNLVNIQQVKGDDLEIVDTDKYCYIMTYSFPCQDLSLAGKGKGMSDTSTRSGMLWEVERILDECKKLGELPQILLMENVPQVHGEGNVNDFNKWQLRLEQLGYKNYWEDLIATDYGIPQTRNRCFMISILGDYSYNFPPKQKLKLKLKDMLEDEVDEKYYLSEKMIDYVTSRMPSGDNKITTGINMGNKETLEKAGTLTTNAGNRPTDNFIIENENYDYSKEQGKIIQKMNLYDYGIKQYNRRTGVVVDTEGSSATLLARKQGDNNMIYIKNATAKGYLEARDGDGVDISSRMEYHRGTVQKGKTQTLSTMGGENNGVVVKMKQELCNELIKNNKVKENDVIRHNYTSSKNGDCIQSNNEAPTLDTRCDCLGVVNNMRIRKLTPRECLRLQGVRDNDIDNMMNNQSNASLYHLAGDSIVINVLEAIIKELI